MSELDGCGTVVVVISPKIGAGGWVLFTHWGEEQALLVARVRFAAREDGRLEPVEAHFEGAARLTGDTLRGLPLGQMEAWANGPGRAKVTEQIEKDGPKVERSTDKWLTVVGAGDRDMTIELGIPLAEKIGRAKRRLRIPEGPKLPDSFYTKVAELYSALAASGSRRPAQEIADANDVTVTRVHRWVREARRRELLGSGRRGKAG
jgi:hypothetical protein